MNAKTAMYAVFFLYGTFQDSFEFGMHKILHPNILHLVSLVISGTTPPQQEPMNILCIEYNLYYK